jgi:hypothetical protein
LEEAEVRRCDLVGCELAAGVQPPSPLPLLGPGVHRDDADGGLLSVQTRVVGQYRARVVR